MELLLDKQTSDGAGTIVRAGDGGFLSIHATGVFGGASVKLQGRMSDFDFVDLQDMNGGVLSITAPMVCAVMYIKAGMEVRAVVSSAGSSTELTLGCM